MEAALADKISDDAVVVITKKELEEAALWSVNSEVLQSQATLLQGGKVPGICALTRS